MESKTSQITLAIFLGFSLSMLAMGSAEAQTQYISATRLQNLRQGQTKPIIIDTRSPGNYRKAHIPGSINIPGYQLPLKQDQLKKYRGRSIYLVCAKGNNARRAARWLQKKGYKKLKVLRGGLIAWQKKGLPLEGSSNEPLRSCQ
jgi:rhodanese-related sulfurtransferase